MRRNSIDSHDAAASTTVRDGSGDRLTERGRRIGNVPDQLRQLRQDQRDQGLSTAAGAAAAVLTRRGRTRGTRPTSAGHSINWKTRPCRGWKGCVTRKVWGAPLVGG